MRKIFRLTILALFLLTLFLGNLLNASEGIQVSVPLEVEKLKVGDVIDDFTLRDFCVNDTVSFEKDIKGSYKVIAFGFGIKDHPDCGCSVDVISRLANKWYTDFKAFEVNLDNTAEESRFQCDRDMGMLVDMLMDPMLTLPKKFGFSGNHDELPCVVIVDGDGKILYVKEGFDTHKDSSVVSEVVSKAIGQ